MSDETKTNQQHITIPVEREIKIQVLANNMLVIDGAFCSGAKSAQEVLQERVNHPFFSKQTRGPRKSKSDADPRVTVPGKKGAGK